MGVIDDALARQAARPAPRVIDYKRMNEVLPGQKAALTRASKAARAAQDALRDSGYTEAAEKNLDAAREKLAKLIKSHVAVWNEIGAWPDQWHSWQIALDDVMGLWNRIDIADL